MTLSMLLISEACQTSALSAISKYHSRKLQYIGAALPRTTGIAFAISVGAEAIDVYTMHIITKSRREKEISNRSRGGDLDTQGIVISYSHIRISFISLYDPSYRLSFDIAMMSTHPPDTTTKQKSRRSLLPSLNFASSSSASSSSHTVSGPSMRATPSTSAAASSGAEPDYFASIHVPDANAPDPGATRIASPFALATPLVSSSGARPSHSTSADASSQDRDAHPWAKLFPDGGMATALPEGFRMAKLGVPPTPAATAAASTTNKLKLPGSSSGSPALPPDFRRTLNLPPKLNGGLSSSASLPLPAGSSSSNTKAGAATNDLTKYKALDVDGLAEALKLPSWKRQANAASSASQPATSEDVLVLDIRPSTSYSMARVASSINICAPSTLLKRPAITVERIEDEMLGSTSDRRRFMRWRKGPLKPKPDAAKAGTSSEASLEAVRKRGATISLPDEPGVTKIIVLDTDTTRIDGTGNATAGGGGPCLIGVLKKFEAAGFAGELCWLVGGFNKLARSKKAQDLIDTNAAGKHAPEEKSSSPDSTRGQSPADVRSRKPPTLELNGSAALPAFGSPAGVDDERKSLVQPRGLPMEAFQTQSTVAGWPGQSASPAKEATQRGGSGDGFRLNLAGRSQGQKGAEAETNRSAAACANPFFDNIRQNRELQHGITEKIPMELPQMSEAQTRHLPPFFQKLVQLSNSDRALALAQVFFDVEKAEQNRLIATMQQHSAESDQDPRSKDFAKAQAAALLKQSSSGAGQRQTLDLSGHAFPFSIAAALERGADNRYNNIWTYEHSRVRLAKPQSVHDSGSDYLNGSYVTPPTGLGSKRRYIATQAPLPSTFAAFWTAVWEQNSRVIVMLTREHESGRLQSHPYWLDTAYGDSIRLTKLEEVVLDEAGHQMRSEESNAVLSKGQNGGALFPTMPASQQDNEASSSTASASKCEPTTVRRTFLLKNFSEPQAAPRKVVQLQYIAWPDYHIPETPQSLLTLMDLADSIQNTADIELGRSITRGPAQSAGPMVVHCSAGVGRTGAFIVIDAALDVLRRVRRRQKLSAMRRDASAVAEPSTWDNHFTDDGSISIANDTQDVDMAAPSSPLADRFPRTPRRSLKRELSPTGMDIDSGSIQGSARDLSSPPPMYRSRSNESGNGADASSLLSSSLSSTGSFSNRSANSLNAAGAKLGPADTPMRSTQSTQTSAAGGESNSGGFTNPFTSPTFRFNPLASARIRSAGTAMQNASSHDSSLSPRHVQDSSDLTLSPTRPSGLQLSSQDAWRQASSPFSEVSTPSFQGGGSGSARSSFSSAAGVHSRLSSGGNALSPSGSDDGVRSIDEALMSAVNPFDVSISQQNQSQTQGESKADYATAGDTTTSTVTGSNEPTPFDASSTSNVFGFAKQTTRASTMSDSNSADSSLNDNVTHRTTPGTSVHSTPANHAQDSSQVLTARDDAKMACGNAGEVDEAYVKGEDIIRTIVEGVREQRMSLIQTGRQFVFVYSAVLAALLKDLSREGIY
ncbi:protein-tyrosine phosphatase domain containing protein [Pseudozyma hubeiensis SY62]|uniref:Protein-tyrosine phosphatase domain containing protein n=1 Tax=Pseudozyma hubeiensis (strain SY62) TaxID=1305764 RepID=R9P3M0_PSEHS|nr:protein-tyrosine phosphatase domain containing protein [Pseudozyma hubeiensis SY62]GAC96053.1 protein-tyrosine phosphatase domain containing protein [Pseudozyma hubeiensis SY62]